eukprot:TRINITY_DN5228_c0_g1_i1.p1 TRINITY_DN5228_c0_g1~~TRINITY_DN5228_c0_g1_i1.p1  ORF type:complete len:370 (+),score=79.28 TRINITY_DN5228_c0_g1_i1:84-1193(+)
MSTDFLIELDDVAEVLTLIPPHLLDYLILRDNPQLELDTKSIKKKRMLISDEIAKSTCKVFVELLNADELESVLEKKIEANKKLPKDERARFSLTRGVLGKRLREILQKESLRDFLKDNLTDQMLIDLCDLLSVENVPSKRVDLLNAAEGALTSHGMRLYFESFPVRFLQSFAKALNLGGNYSSTSKASLIKGIMTGNPIQKKTPVKPRKLGKASSRKPRSIKKGIKEADLMVHFTVDELQKWASTNGVKSNGKKSVLIARIMAYLDGDKSTLKKKSSRRGKRKRKESPVSHTKERKKQKSNGKKKPVESEESSSGEVISLDLDELSDAELEDLKYYCETSKLKVHGRKKSDFIKSIRLYHEQNPDGSD